jgi:glycosyltransferase involved in cell wall biosynthesis
MYLERPVISSNCTPIERIVNECKCGLIYESNNSEDLAQKVISLYNDDELRNSMGENGNREVLQKYNWKSTAENLVNLYKKIQIDIGI